MIQILEYHEQISSTNDRVRELLMQPIKPALPCMVVAQRQTAGRGREHKRWWSEEGAILMSIGFELSPKSLQRDQLPMLSLSAAQSVANVLSRHLTQHRIEVHAPNDVYADGKKISGMLIESPTPQYGILGIGINVNNKLQNIPAEFVADFSARPIISMIELLGKETDLMRLIDELLDELRPKILGAD